MTLRRSFWIAAVALSSVAVERAGVAAPTGEQVIAGQVDVARQGAQTTITASDNSVIRFQSFDIGAQESVIFVQPDARARFHAGRIRQIVGPEPRGFGKRRAGLRHVSRGVGRFARRGVEARQ